jgi:hypothetical protein
VGLETAEMVIATGDVAAVRSEVLSGELHVFDIGIVRCGTIGQAP